ncbi:CLUMA_CG001998, isoform A [Clunio marinus]|uniref:CLUMA_CG001998, isoform A n=1 Tax=Clunio marinus TaxID=568069 RepID=A0A1J1HPS6_9DIPT|nr:CLUMA_CG001998, isoform A [Clunio marinus]
MTDNVKECQEKFINVLSSITPKTVITDDTYLEKIQSYLTFNEYNDFIKCAETIEWIERMVLAFESNDPPTQQNCNFTLKILSLICSNEWQFAAIKEKGLLEKICSGIEKHPQLQRPSVKLSHIQLLHSISQHSIGLHWLKQTKSWKLCINYYQQSNTVFIIKEASSFLFDILTKFTDLMKDENLCVEIVEEIMEPIINFSTEYGTDNIVDDEKLPSIMMPCINVCNHLLMMCIESNKRSRMAYLICQKYRYENKLWVVGDLVQTNVDFLTVLCRGHILANFARLSSMDIPSSDTQAADLKFDIHTIHFYNLMLMCLNRRIFKNVNMICELHHQLWYKLGDRAPKEIVLENHDLKYGDQVVMIQTLPIIYVIRSRYKANAEYINELCTKMFHMSCEHTIRVLYQYRDGLSNESFEFIADLAANSIQKILSLKKFLNRDRAILALQILIHVLKGYVDEPEYGVRDKKTCNTQLVMQAPNLLSALLIGLNEMIKYYNFTWKECIESTTIVTLLLVLLDNPNLSPRQTVESLKLIQTSIEHFLAPNLALLMDKMEGSGMEDLGPTIYKRLHDNSWEVRDSTLELVHSIVEISDEKFPPFQRHILESKVCHIVEIIARNDSEPYVRASALKVLASMIKIRAFWEHSLHQLDVKKYAVEVLGAESEGVVRREAVACITAVYRQHQIQPACLDLIFSVLTHCAVNDFYWQVRVNALGFWRTVICRQFSHQGMIDGTFPAVTFSKEHKKIITLNDKEIHLRLRKVLNELSLRGCLGILISCLQDSDLEVIKVAVAIVDRIMIYLNKYNFVEEYNKSKKPTTVSVDPVKPVIDSNYSEFENNLHETKGPVVRNNADFRKKTEVSISKENGECCPDDTIIDLIVQSDDILLLTNKCKMNLQVTCEISMGKIDENLFKKYATVSPDEFLDFVTKTNFDELIKEKSEWLKHSENFSTLLDDVLRSFGISMDLDCY